MEFVAIKRFILIVRGILYALCCPQIQQLKILLGGDVQQRIVLALAAGSGSKDTFQAVLAAVRQDLTPDEVGIISTSHLRNWCSQRWYHLCSVELYQVLRLVGHLIDCSCVIRSQRVNIGADYDCRFACPTR